MNRQSIFENGDQSLDLCAVFRQIRLDRRCRSVMESSALLSKRLLDNFENCLEHFVLKEHMFLNPKISITFLADKLHTNRTYVSCAIHSLYGVSFSEFVSVLRIEYSKNLLKKFRLNIECVASACGYQYVSQFSRKFTEVVGVTPSTWRQYVLDGIGRQ